MSGMAEDMSRRMESAGDSAPGTGGDSPPAGQQSPAGESNADTAAGGGAPETIPYARFKEVNDRYSALKGFEELVGYGYDPDSLGRLAAFEAQYTQDPGGTIASLVKDLDLPQEQKDQIEQYLTSASDDGGDQKPEKDEKPPVPPEVQELLEWKREQEALREQSANDELLDSIVGEWDRLDTTDDVPKELLPDEETKLMYISQAAREGGFTSPEQLAQRAREKLSAYNERLLGSTVQRGRRPGSPLPVPSGGSPASDPVKFSSLREAGQAAMKDIEEGRLPGTSRGG